MSPPICHGKVPVEAFALVIDPSAFRLGLRALPTWRPHQDGGKPHPDIMRDRRDLSRRSPAARLAMLETEGAISTLARSFREDHP